MGTQVGFSNCQTKHSAVAPLAIRRFAKEFGNINRDLNPKAAPFLAASGQSQAGSGMGKNPNLRDSKVTTAQLVARWHGLNVHCACGHHGAITPKTLAQAPDTQIYEYKCRLKCSRCGRPGCTDDIEVRVYIETAPFSGQYARARIGTPPQLA